MKNILLVSICMMSAIIAKTQSVGIGNSNPDSSAILDLSNPDNKGVLIPSMTTAAKDSIEDPADGLLVYQTDSIPGFYFFDGTVWGRIGGGGNAWEETDSTVYTTKFVGINSDVPQNHLDVRGNLVITVPRVTTDSEPSPTQTKTMINNELIAFESIDSTGRFFDTGGPNGQYGPNNTNTRCFIPSTIVCIGIEVNIEEIDLGEGDSLILRKDHSSGEIVFAFGHENNTIGTFTINAPSLSFKFTSDASTTTLGEGFSIIFKRIYPDQNTIDASGYLGNALVFESKSGSFKGGSIKRSTTPGDRSFCFGKLNEAIGANSISIGNDNTSTGAQSSSFGYSNMATGSNSFAIGEGTRAEGLNSFAAGRNTHATGFNSFASGEVTMASGYGSFAAGGWTESSGDYAFATGYFTEAAGDYAFAAGGWTESSGDYAFASGRHTIANGFAGMVIGINNSPILSSPQTVVTEDTPLFIIGNGSSFNDRSNAMVVRKDGNVGLGTNNPRITLHIADGTDAGLNDDNGYLVTGNVNGINLLMDDNEIMVRNNGVAADLFLQHNGGKVLIGTGGTGNLFDVNGTAGKPGGGSWSGLSDSRLKDQIRPYTDGLQSLLNIRPVAYHYAPFSGYDSTPEYVGIIAQELQSVAPYMVTVSDKVYPDGSTDYLQVDNSAMTYMLINAVKELHAEIENLKSEIQELRKEESEK